MNQLEETNVLVKALLFRDANDGSKLDASLLENTMQQQLTEMTNY